MIIQTCYCSQKLSNLMLLYKFVIRYILLVKILIKRKMNNPYHVKQIYTEKSSLIEYDVYENRCLSPIRRSRRPTQIFIPNDQLLKLSPRRLSRTPTRQYHNYKTQRTPQKNRTPTKYHKNPILQRVDPLVSYKPIHDENKFSHHPSEINQYKYSTNPKLFTNLMSKIGSTQKQKENILFTNQEEIKYIKQKQNHRQKLADLQKNSFSALLQNIKAVESVDFYQNDNKNQQISKQSNFLFPICISPRETPIKKQKSQIDQRPINNGIQSQILKWSLKNNQMLKDSSNDFDDIAKLLQKISNNNTYQDQGCVNISIDKNPKESFNMDAFI